MFLILAISHLVSPFSLDFHTVNIKSASKWYTEIPQVLPI
jgi:hypothetical protein